MQRTLNDPKIGVVIIESDASKLAGLRNYLQIRFGKLLRISTFRTGAAALPNIDKTTDLVILENYLYGENNADVRTLIKEKKQNIQVVSLGTKREMGDAVEIYNNGVNRSPGPRRPGSEFFMPVYRFITYPARLISKEFRVNAFLGAMFASILFIGLMTLLFIGFIL